MTSHPSAVTQRPQFRTATSTFPNHIDRINSQSYQRVRRSVPRQAIRDSTYAPHPSQDSFQPAVKRQKLTAEINLPGSIHQGTKFETSPSTGTLSTFPQQASQYTWVKNPPIREDLSPSIASNDESISHDCSPPLPPFPVRPGRHALRRGIQPANELAIHNQTRGEDVRVKPYILEVPSSAPRYRQDEPADFFPWTGNRPEDVLNEATTRQGFYDKIQISQNETSTARPSVWSSLKHKSGLQILSSLLVSALDKRQAHGMITATCTFKPPPRVTLTDTKREAWLRDLANPTISLRRLSRTIPHGIRGKALLDHCLTKNIPTDRAIWLAKCVGANEIRAFKRKGTSGAFAVGGETKWMRDWTLNLEQFIETIIGCCGTSEWNAKVNYGLRLASHLFSEHLLDQDHYLDWILASLYNSDLDNVSIWLLVAQIHWKEILQFRQRGRRLAEALLEQFRKAKYNDSEETYVPILQWLAKMLRSFMRISPSCFILPNCWAKYQSVLKVCLDEHDSAACSSFERLSRRNARLTTALNGKTDHMRKSPMQRLISLLDNIPARYSITEISEACLKSVDNSDLRVTTLLEWASSLYRSGLARLYIALRLLRRWAKTGVDLNQPILAFLAANRDMTGQQSSIIFRIIAELVRSKNFSIGRYLQWLMARGALRDRNSLLQDDSCDIRLLSELPLHGLPVHMINLRQLLLASVGVSTADEDVSIFSAKARLAEQIPGFCSSARTSAYRNLKLSNTRDLSQTVKFDIGRWVRQCVADRLQRHGADAFVEPEDPISDCSSLDSLSLKEFRDIKVLLEDLNDFPILADILEMFSECEDCLILAFAVDTINQHLNVLVAIGAAGDLFRSFCNQYEAICSRKAEEKPLVISLIDLAGRLPGSAQAARKLRKDLLLYEQKFTAAACSPISDHMAEALQSAEINFTDEVEQLLASGTSMDKQTMTQIFRTMMKRLDYSWADSAQSSFQIVELLARLRPFDAIKFDTLILEWLEEVLISIDRPKISMIIPPLICAGCLTLETVLGQARLLLSDIERSDYLFDRATEMLEILTRKDFATLSADCKRYRFHEQQHRALQTSSSPVMALVGATVEACSKAGEPQRARAQALISSPEVITLTRNLVLYRSEDLPMIESMFAVGLSIIQVQRAIDGMIDPAHQFNLLHLDASAQVSSLSQILSDFNIPLCKLKLNALFDGASETISDTMVNTLVERAKSSISSDSYLWKSVLSGLSHPHGIRIREKAEDELLSAILDWTTKNQDNSDDLESSKHLLSSLLSIIDATGFTIVDVGASLLITQIADKLLGIISFFQLTTLTDNLSSGREENRPENSERRLKMVYLWLDALLRLLTIHQSTLQHSRFSQINLSCLLINLSVLLIHPLLTSHPNLSLQIFDVVAIFTDSLLDETRSRCIRILRDQHKASDSRLHFLFGYSEAVEGEWLQLATSSSSSLEPRKAVAAGAKLTAAPQPFPLRRWEMMQDATPLVGENDTSLSLSLFGARKAVL